MTRLFLLQTAESEGAPFSAAVCPADEARALMKLKWNRYINRQKRTTPHKKAQTPIFLYRVVLSFCKLLLIPLKHHSLRELG